MAVTNIVISDNQTSATGGNKRITSASTPQNLYIKFRTMNRDAQQKIDVAVAYEYVARGDVRGGDGYGGYTELNGSTEWYYKQFIVATDQTLWVSERDALVPGYLWSVPLAFPSQNHSDATIVSAITNGDWSFANRKFDAIHLHIKIKTLYESGGELMTSDLAEADRYIGYIPSYDIDENNPIVFDLEGLKVYYTADDWDRSSDRFEVTYLTQAGKSLIDTKSKPWGSVRSAGLIVIPKDKLIRQPTDGTVSGSIRMNATWRPAGEDFASIALIAAPVDNQTGTRTPNVSMTIDSEDGSLTVTVTQGSGTDQLATTANVVLIDGETKEDNQTVTIGGSAVFHPTFGRTFSVSVTAFSAQGVRSARVVKSGIMTTLDGATLSLSDGSTIRIPYGVSVSDSSGPEVEVVKMAGRQRPSVFFGEGGTRSLSVKGFVCVEEGHNMEVTDPDALSALPMSGPCLYRDDTGRRVYGYVSDQGSDHGATFPWMREVSLSIEEVSR